MATMTLELDVLVCAGISIEAAEGLRSIAAGLSKLERAGIPGGTNGRAKFHDTITALNSRLARVLENLGNAEGAAE